MNDAARTLDVKKRRLYDVTSVLMGIDLIEKRSRSVVAFKDPSILAAFCNATGGGAGDGAPMSSSARRRMGALEAESRLLDASITALRGEMDALRSDPDHAALAYLTRRDVSSLAMFRNSTVLALQAPPGTQIVVPGAQLRW